MSAHRSNGTRGKVNGQPVHLSNLKIINGCLLFDVCSGKFHRISETAAFVLDELKKQTPISKIIVVYAQRYEIPQAVAARDIELFMNDISVMA
jgi:hypothetical protein